MDRSNSLSKKKQGLAIDLSLQEKDSNYIKDKVFSDVKLQDFKCDDGVEKLIQFMGKLLKKMSLLKHTKHLVILID